MIMRVLHLGNTAGVGLELVRFLAQKGISANLISFYDEHVHAYFKDHAINLHVSATSSILRKIGILPYIFSKSTDYDILHFHSKFGQIGFIPKIFQHKDFVLHFHGSDIRDWHSYNVIYKSLLSMSTRYAKKIIVSTPDLLSCLGAFLLKKGHLHLKALYLPNPIDIHLFRPSNNKRIDLYNGYDYVLLMPSAPSFKKKGHHLMIKALELLILRYVINGKMRLIFIKPKTFSPELEAILSYAQRRRFREMVHVLPRRPKEFMPILYNSSDIVIDQFIIGTLGQISLEALSCSKPVVTYYNHIYDVYYPSPPPVVSVRTPDQIAKAIAYLLEDSSLRKKLGYEGRNWILKTHNAETIVGKLLSIYEEILDDKSC